MNAADGGCLFCPWRKRKRNKAMTKSISSGKGMAGKRGKV